MKKSTNQKLMGLLLGILLLFNSFMQGKDVPEHLQKISVTIKANGSEGSGTLISRKIDDEEVSFVWTAAHVIDSLRKTREVIDSASGTKRTVIEFKDAAIVRELVEDGRRVGEVEMDARVIRYSDADDGEDLALLMVLKRGYAEDSAVFYLDEKRKIIPISTPLLHVGSLLGQMGSNSMTTGIVSQIGRTIGKKEYDQTTVTAFPGSSGGGVFLKDGRYVGMLVRGSGEQFNLIVPIRRMRSWADSAGVLWAIDPEHKAPSLKQIEAMPIEDSGYQFGKREKESATKTSEIKFLIRRDSTKSAARDEPTPRVRKLSGETDRN